MSRAEVWFLVIGSDRIDCGLWHSGAFQDVWAEPIGPSDTTDGLTSWRKAWERLLDSLSKRAEGEQGVRRLSRPALRVLVSGRWLAANVLPWSPSLLGETSRSFAVGQLVEAGFELEAQASLRTDDLPAGRPRLAVAYPPQLHAALASGAAKFGWQIESVLPLEFAAWLSLRSELPRGKAMLAVVEGGSATLLGGTGRELQSMSQALDPRMREADAPLALGLVWQRQRARDPHTLDVPVLHVLDLNPRESALVLDARTMAATGAGDAEAEVRIPPALRVACSVPRRQHALDAIQTRSSAGIFAWSAAVAALLIAIVAGQRWYEAATQLRGAEASLAPRTPVARTVPKAKPGREEIARMQAATQAVRELNLPLDALLQAMIPPRDIRVAVTGLAIDGGTPESSGPSGSIIRLSAEARTAIEMTRYVAYLTERRAFASAYLVRHEVANGQTGWPLRFTVELAWHQ